MKPVFYIMLSAFRKLCFILLLLMEAWGSWAQDTESKGGSADTINRHSPRLATLLSVVCPGAGQIYNRKYWKAPVVWTGLAVSVYSINYFQARYTDYRLAYKDYMLEGDKSEVLYDLLKKYEPNRTIDPKFYKEYLTYYKTDYQRNMNLSYIAAGLIYFMNVIDAMVDAYFYDFDVSDKITLRMQPDMLSSFRYVYVAGLRCVVYF